MSLNSSKESSVVSTPGSVASHYNAVPNSGLQERTNSRIYHLRNFNNWMKSMLISDFIERLRHEGCPSATVLDLCCGKGGDLLKWKIGNIKSVVMTDVADVALNHCRNRYEELRDRFARERRQPFDAHFIHADATQDILRDSYPDRNMQFDIVSCQFALHYSFASEQSARRLLSNAADALRPGGYFIGTLPDGSSIMNFLRKSDDGIFRNDVVKVTYTGNTIVSRITSHLLFGIFPLLIKILDEFDMELVYHHSFPDAVKYYLENNPREARPLMNRMRALEVYPPFPSNPLVGNETEYEHASEKMKELNAGPNERMGTLSKSEWEVVSMYLVFAFRKKSAKNSLLCLRSYTPLYVHCCCCCCVPRKFFNLLSLIFAFFWFE
uniref:mRNA cap guanine-N(7) methyltransferase n=1 Tax=Ditylenchus dipsaci TaxID=166011 RepID=A0A915EQY8_9BILA